MKRLTLNPDALHVDSFEAMATEPVFMAAAGTFYLPCQTGSCQTCNLTGCMGNTCYADCGTDTVADTQAA